MILLSVHGSVFYGWMILMVVQTALVRLRHIRLAPVARMVRRCDAAMVVIMGLWASFHQPAPLAAEMVGVLSMAGFGVPVALAILWRKRPAYHRRLLLIGTAMLTNAAFARFPGTYLPGHFFYAGTDLLIAIGIVHDLWKEGSVHVIYRYAIVILLVAEIVVLIPAWPYLSSQVTYLPRERKLRWRKQGKPRFQNCAGWKRGLTIWRKTRTLSTTPSPSLPPQAN